MERFSLHLDINTKILITVHSRGEEFMVGKTGNTVNCILAASGDL
jgi:hypothetical protein